ncbi:hypothetical protein IE53DRAFT_86176 [Violaceomyces palustris]|uniref:Uncharacterized protein n=1 Tax=Violaceomyces palustris TaxID=1673888 RepID=A0ACD0NXW2_9BASI|nr:hypothetical protein IE53DRAFT_86176 [Violaceomyces palustris]
MYASGALDQNGARQAIELSSDSEASFSSPLTSSVPPLSADDLSGSGGDAARRDVGHRDMNGSAVDIKSLALKVDQEQAPSTATLAPPPALQRTPTTSSSDKGNDRPPPDQTLDEYSTKSSSLSQSSKPAPDSLDSNLVGQEQEQEQEQQDEASAQASTSTATAVAAKSKATDHRPAGDVATTTAITTTSPSSPSPSTTSARSTITNRGDPNERVIENPKIDPSDSSPPAAASNPIPKTKSHFEPSVLATSKASRDSPTLPGPAPPAPQPITTPQSIPSPRATPSSKSQNLKMTSVMAQGGSFIPAQRVDITKVTLSHLGSMIKDTVDNRGIPLIVENVHKTNRWPSFFKAEDYIRMIGQDTIVQARNVLTWEDKEINLGQLFELAASAGETLLPTDQERFYGKDLECPLQWQEALASGMLPPEIVYHGHHDLAGSLNPNERPETLLCYLGSGDTWTPMHRDLCASLGQNLMTWSDPDATAFWFMTSSQDTDAAKTYIDSLGHEFDLEGTCADVEELRKAPFPFYVCEQRVGDLVLLPSRSIHQVINCGGRSIKAAWSRLTLKTLKTALHQDLPIYQRHCRRESYRTKEVIAASLRKVTERVSSSQSKDVAADLHLIKQLVSLYDEILADEYHPDWQTHRIIGSSDNYVECDFCGADVFQSFFECPKGDTLCAMCYCQGRSCDCTSSLELEPCQLVPFIDRMEIRHKAANVLNRLKEHYGLSAIEPITEESLGSSLWPHSYIAACKLRWTRQQSNEDNAASCRYCKGMYTSPNRYKCKPCHYSFCFACILRKFFIHPVHALAQDDQEGFHAYHRGESKKQYDNYKNNPQTLPACTLAHFNLIEAAITKPRCKPLKPTCKIGFIDQTEQFPNGPPGAPITAPTLHGASVGTPKREIPSRGSKRPSDAMSNSSSLSDIASRPDSAAKKARKSSPFRKSVSPKVSNAPVSCKDSS